MKGKNGRNGGTQRRRRAHKLIDAFDQLSISEGTGHALIKAGKIRVVRLGPRSPRITDEEIDRILEEGIQ